ncbi:MAG TPA: hypothetical protein VF599_18815 [Pyrinomonadaceae bacterium]
MKNELPPNNSVSIVNETKPRQTFSAPDLCVPDGWILVARPKAKSREIRCAESRRDFQWRVETDNETVKISKYDEWAIDEQIEKLPLNLREIVLQTRDIGNGAAYFHIEPYENGWLAGLDAGEWGGRLSWFSSDGSRKAIILQDNIRGIARVGNEVLILRGLAHLTSSEGRVSKLVRDENGNLQAQDLVDLESAPQSFAVESDSSVLISLEDKIVRVKTSGAMETWREMPLNYLNVSMAATNSGTVYVGMWRYVVRFIPAREGIREQWLAPRNCQKFSFQNDECVCRGEKINKERRQ